MNRSYRKPISNKGKIVKKMNIAGAANNGFLEFGILDFQKTVDNTFGGEEFEADDSWMDDFDREMKKKLDRIDSEISLKEANGIDLDKERINEEIWDIIDTFTEHKYSI